MTDVDQAMERLLSTAERLEPGAQSRASLLPGWTVGHVLTHLARNADSYTNLLTWARTGVETPQYPTPTARAEGIEAGRERPPAEQVADLRDSHERFADAAAAMTAEAWTFVLPATGRSAAALPWGRLREVEVHHVDLGAGYSPEDWSDAFALRLLREIAGDAAPDATPLILRPQGIDHPVTLGRATGSTPVIGGPTRSIAAWLAGRGDGAGLTVAPDGELPVPVRWK